MAEGQADVLVTVGIDTGASVGKIKADLGSIEGQIQSTPIKIIAQLSEESKGSLGQQIQQAIAAASQSGTTAIEINEVRIGTGALASFRSQLESMINAVSIDKGVTIMMEAKGAGTFETQISAIDQLKMQIKELNDMSGSMGSAIKKLGEGSTAEETAKIKEIASQYDALKSKIDEIKQSRQAMSEEQRNALQEQANGIQKEIDALNEATEAKKRSAEADKQAEKAAAAKVREEQQYSTAVKQSADLMARMQNAQKTWTAAKYGSSKEDYNAISGYIDRLKELDTQLGAGGISRQKYSSGIKEIAAEFAQSSTAIKAAGENTRSVFDQIAGAAQKFSSWFSVTRVIMEVVRAIKQMVSASIELNSAFAQIQIVTGASESEMRQFANSTIQLASDLGKSVSEMAKTIETFSRLGYDLPDASKLAEFASILSNVANVSMDEATTGLTSIIKGFNMEVGDAEHVADVLTQVGQKFAISAAEMMTAYEKSGAALSATGTSFEKSAGLLAAGNAAVQNANTVGKRVAQARSNARPSTQV